MQVSSDRRYEFAVRPDEFWEAISRVEDYRVWWPWLRHLDAVGMVAGDRWSCVVQPPMPYSLRFRVTLDEVLPPTRITATISGDIGGSAVLEIGDHPGGCQARLTSSLSPNNRLLQTVARVARPLVRFGHDWVLDTGARQFSSRALT